jgi:acetylornithine deacetylase/succinyl-diaminopimelate desuccinylase-like protein
MATQAKKEPDPGRLADELAQITRIKRVSGAEHGVIDWFKARFTQHGLQFKHSGRNLLAWRGAGKRRLLMNTHTDTVPPNKGYTREPWDGAREGGRVYGLGSSDAGGCLIGMFHWRVAPAAATARWHATSLASSAMWALATPTMSVACAVARAARTRRNGAQR